MCTELPKVHLLRWIVRIVPIAHVDYLQLRIRLGVRPGCDPRDWPFGAALSLALMAIAMVLLFAARRKGEELL